MATVKSPVQGFNGTVVGVQFTDGVGETDEERALAYFSRQGYDISEAEGFSLEPESQPGGTVIADVLGTPAFNPPGPLDAADPDNDLVPVGGVKSSAAPGAPEAKSSKGRRSRNTSDKPADTTPVEPVAAAGNVQSAPSATTATTPSAAPVGDDSAPDVTSATPAPDQSQPEQNATTTPTANTAGITADAPQAPEDGEAAGTTPGATTASTKGA